MAHAARARSRRNARMHARVGTRHRGRVLRRSRSATTSTWTATCSCARTPCPGVELVDTESGFRRSRPGRLGSSAVSTEPRRILILGEGFSHDAHYGKTMRGIIRYGPDPVVAILDSARRRSARGDPDRRDGRGCAPVGPTVAVVGVATQGDGSRLLGASSAELDRERPRRRKRPPRVRLGGCGADRLAGRHGVELRDLRRPPTGLNVPTGANLEVDAKIVLTVGSDCAIGKKTVAVELALEARRRGLEIRLRADRSDGDRDRRLGDRGRRGGGGLPRGRSRAARRRGCGAREAALRRGPGLARAPAVLGRDPRARARIGAARVRPLPSRGRHRDRRVLRTPDSSARGLVELHERISLPRRHAKVVCMALNTAASRRTRTHARRYRGCGDGDRASRGRPGPLRSRPAP